MVTNISKVSKEKNTKHIHTKSKKEKEIKPCSVITTGGMNMRICARGEGGEEQPFQVISVMSLKFRLIPIFRLDVECCQPCMYGLVISVTLVISTLNKT